MVKSKLSKADVIVPPNHPNPPEPHEVDTAWVLARHYDCVVAFVIPVNDYARSSLDVLMRGVLIELKSPIGNSLKHTIKEQFDRASSQHAAVLVLDGRRTKLTDEHIIGKIKNELKYRRRIKKVIFVAKSEEIVEFQK
jgi:hypothetical protein